MDSTTANTFDPAAYKPQQAQGAEVFDRGAAEAAARYAITTESIRTVAILSEEEKKLWDRFDGQASVNDICIRFLEDEQSQVLSRVYALIGRLWEHGLLTEDPYLRESRSRGVPATDEATFGLRLPLPGTGPLSSIMGGLLKIAMLSARPVIVLAIMAIAVGLGAISNLQLQPLFRFKQAFEGTFIGDVTTTYGYGLLLMIVIGVIASFIRELFVSAVEGSFTGRYPTMTFGLYGVPSFHHPRKWRSILPIRQRMVTDFAGIGFELLLVAICVLLLILNSNHTLSLSTFGVALTYKVMYVLLIRSFLHLSPFTGSDLHGIMSECIRLQNFRQKAFSFVQHKLTETLTMRNQMSREHGFFLGYIGSIVLWVFLVTRLGQVVMTHDDDLKIDMLNMFSAWISQSPAHGQTDNVLVVVLLLLLVSVVLSFILSIFCMFYFVWSFLSQQPLFRRPNAALAVAAGGLIVFILAITQVPKELHDLYTLAAGSAGVVLLLAGLFMAYCTFRGGASPAALQIGTVGLATAAGGACVFNHAVVGSPVPIELIAGVLLIPQVLSVLLRQQFSFLWRGTVFALPIWLFFIGLALFVISLVGALGSGAANGAAMGLGAEQVDFIAFVLMALSVVAYHAHLDEVSLDADLLILDDPAGDEAGALAMTFNELQQNIGQSLREKCGSFTQVIERRVGKSGFAFSKNMDLDGDDLDGLRRDIHGIVSDIDASIARYFGADFSNKVFHQAFNKLNYECYLVLYQNVLKNTRFSFPDSTVTGANCLELYNGINFFQSLGEEDKLFLSQRMVLQHFPTDTLLVQSGDVADFCYIIVDGRAQVEEVDLVGDSYLLAFLNRGDFFGEAALLENSRRMANVRTVTPTTTLTLYREDVETLGEKRPEIVETIRRQLEIMHFLFSIRLFADLPSVIVRSVLSKITIGTYKNGDTLFRRGDAGDHFYLIQSGSVSIIDESSDGEKEVAELGTHDYFGAIALIKDVPRTMTARCLADTEALLLEKEATLQLIEGSKMFAANINRAGGARLEKSGL